MKRVRSLESIEKKVLMTSSEPLGSIGAFPKGCKMIRFNHVRVAERSSSDFLHASAVSLLACAALVGCGSGAGSTSNGPAQSVPAATLSSAALNFTGNAGTPSGAQTVTLSNTGNATLAVGAISVSGSSAASFSQTNSCGASLAAGASCPIIVNFAATTAGNYTAALTVLDNAGNSPQSVALTGNETAPTVSLSASTLSLSTPAESTSAIQTVTLTNTGDGSLKISGLSLGGANAASFNKTDTCSATLAPAATCTLSVSLTAYLATAYSASISIASNAPASPTTFPITGTGTGAITLNTANAADWVINNGAVTLDFNPAQFHVFAIRLAGDTNNLVDVTNRSSKDGQPQGFYMGNQGLGAGTLYTGSKQVGNAYLDFWAGMSSSATNFLTYEMHFVVTANDPGFHTYYVVKHSPTDITGALSLVLWQFRTNLGLFTHSYEVDTGLSNLGVIDTPIPSPYNPQFNEAGRQVQNAVVDIHGITDSATQDFINTTGRGFYTKYDYCTYEYLHHEQGVYGPLYGAWAVLPRTETIAGGPSKQDVDILNQIIQQEQSGAHFVGGLDYVPPQGVDTTKLYGPVYYHFNQFNTTHTTPSSLYQEANNWLPWFDTLYDNDPILTGDTYVPSTGRGTVAPTITGGGSTRPYTAWAVLSDPLTNFQYTATGFDYWTSNNAAGTAPLTGVAPGTYRLSAYVLGQWGELRKDNVVVTANQTTAVGPLTFTPENFSTQPAVWAIGTPDRSAHEFLHGHDAVGNDLRNFQGAYNYWADFAPNLGKQVYYATAVGSTPATNDLNKINYVQWNTFNPGLYAGVYNPNDLTTAGYSYIVPSYVTNPATQSTGGLAVHFTTTAAQASQGQYSVVSAGLAGVEGSFIATLNGHQLIWHVIHNSDPMVRSGLSGYYQWVAFEWPTAYLNAPGTDNVLQFGVSQIGVMVDALRMEITNTSSDPLITNWHDYEYVSASKYTGANDTLPNN